MPDIASLNFTKQALLQLPTPGPGRRITYHDFDEYRRRTAPFLRRPDKQEQTFRLYLSHWARRPLDQIRYRDVDGLHKDLARSVSETTANIALKLLHTLFNRAKYEWRIWEGDNPAHGVKKFKEKSRERFVLPKEMPYLLRAIQLEPNETIRDASLIALFTGARRANVQAMAWSELDLECGLWRVPLTKNGRPQLIHLCPEAVELLDTRSGTASSPFVFPGPGKTGHLQEIKSGWARILSRAEGLYYLGVAVRSNRIASNQIPQWESYLVALPHATCEELRTALLTAGKAADHFNMSDLWFHDLRRTHATWMLRAGAGKHLVGKQLNHLSAQTTEVYARVLPGDEVPYVDSAVTSMLRAASLSKRPTDTLREMVSGTAD